MKIRKRKEEDPGDLLGQEPQYYPEGEYSGQQSAGDTQQKYVPRHRNKKGKAAKREAEAVPLLPAQNQVYTDIPSPASTPKPPPVVSRPEPVRPPETNRPPADEPREESAEKKPEPVVEGATPGFGYYWVPPPVYPPPYNPQVPGCGGIPPESGPPPGVGYPYPPPPIGAPFGEPLPPFDKPYAPTGYDDELEFRELAEDSESHWRVDFKWIFGILAVFMMLGTLAAICFYRTSGTGSSKEILSSLILNTTEVEEVIDENYTDLRSKARKKKSAVIVIPDIDMDIEVSGEDVLSMDEGELAKEVASQIEQITYAQGYKGDLPMKYAQGAGEERARAVCVTFLGSLNKGNHENLLIVIIIMAGLSFVFLVLFIVFCRGWGRVVGPGVLLICAGLPGSLFLRLGGAFFWNTSQAGLYEGAMYQALIDIASASALFFDIALGVGALLLLVGVIGGAVSGRRRKRVPPFMSLETQEEIVADSVSPE